jgi:hypothetical protein
MWGRKWTQDARRGHSQADFYLSKAAVWNANPQPQVCEFRFCKGRKTGHKATNHIIRGQTHVDRTSAPQACTQESPPEHCSPQYFHAVTNTSQSGQLANAVTNQAVPVLLLDPTSPSWTGTLPTLSCWNISSLGPRACSSQEPIGTWSSAQTQACAGIAKVPQPLRDPRMEGVQA